MRIPNAPIPPAVDPSSQAEEDVPPIAVAGKERTDSAKERLLIEDAEDRKADRALRAEYARKAHEIVVASLIGWSVFISWYGVSNQLGHPPFTDTVVIAITSATTLNIFAAFLCVVRGLFPGGASKTAKKSKRKK